MIRTIAFALLALEPSIAYAQTATVPLPGTRPDPTAPVSPPNPVVTPAVPPVADPQASTNPYGRAIDLIVTVQFGSRELGELPLHMDRAGLVNFDGKAFSTLLAPLLNTNGQAQLAAVVAAHPWVSPQDLQAAGIDAVFDSANVAILIRRINNRFRTPQPIYSEPDNSMERAITANPEKVSFQLNLGLSETKVWNGPRAGWRDPSLFIGSALRVGPIVLEMQGQFADRQPGQIDPQYRFDRTYARMVYDLPADYIRIIAGDLTPEVRMQQNYVQMGGIGVSRQKRRFDEFHSAILQGNRQLILQSESTVDVYRNGVLFQQIQLAPGAYDLANLPLLSGSNDIRIDVHDATGASQSLAYQTYVDPIDLDPGDWEAGLYVGKISSNFGTSPTYNGQLALTGFYRKAFIGRPAIGFGVQASSSVQQLSAQTQFLVGSGARLDATVAGSHSPLGTGWLAGISYDLSLSKGSRADSVNLQGTWQTRHFTGLGAPSQSNSNALSASLTYSHSFSTVASMQAGVTYSKNRAPLGDDYRIFLDADYRLSHVWSIRGGVDYQHFGLAALSRRRSGFGFNIALVFQPSAADRAEARYNYHLDAAQLSYQHSPDGYVGSIGFGALAQRTADFSNLTGYASYRGNRFDAGISQSMSGTTIGSVTDRQVTNFRISSAIVVAGGAVSVTRRVGDSFAIVDPHPTLGDHKVVIGQLLTESRYHSRSGALGGAVGGLGSYQTQSVFYDVEDAPAGYDIGAGVARVRPPYRSGYHLVAGSDAYVTAVGTLLGPGDVPISAAGGQLIDLTKPDERAVSIFSNSVGRFAAINLRPGHRYRVALYSGATFEFTVPEKSDALLDLKQISPEGRE